MTTKASKISKGKSTIKADSNNERYYRQLNKRFFKTQFSQWEINPESAAGVAELATECDHLRAGLLAGWNLLKEFSERSKGKLTAKQTEQMQAFKHAMNYLSPKFKGLANSARGAVVKADEAGGAECQE